MMNESIKPIAESEGMKPLAMTIKGNKIKKIVSSLLPFLYPAGTRSPQEYGYCVHSYVFVLYRNQIV